MFLVKGFNNMMIMKKQTMKRTWKSMVWFLFTMVLGTGAFSLVGVWKTGREHDFLIHVEEDKVVGIMDQSKVEMRLVHSDPSHFILEKLRVVRKPSDWYNYRKYKPFIQWFQKIQKQEVVMGEYRVLEPDVVVVQPHIGDCEYHIFLFRVLEKNDFEKQRDENKKD